MRLNVSGCGVNGRRSGLTGAQHAFAASTFHRDGSETSNFTLHLMFTGTDSTAYTMCRAMQQLALHPQWMATLAEEQQRLIAEHGEDLDRKVCEKFLWPEMQTTGSAPSR